VISLLASPLARYLGAALLVMAAMAGIRHSGVRAGRAQVMPQLLEAQAYGQHVTMANASQRDAIDRLAAANLNWATLAGIGADMAAIAGQEAAEYRAALIAAQRPRDTAPDCLALESCA
jgi:hypothetical protein